MRVESLRRKHPDLDVRAAIAHDESVDPADYPRYAKLNVIPVLSLQWGKAGLGHDRRRAGLSRPGTFSTHGTLRIFARRRRPNRLRQ